MVFLLDIVQAKKLLRKELLAERKAWLAEQEQEQEQNSINVHGRLCDIIQGFMAQRSFTKVLGYWPFGAEPDLRTLYRRLMDDPKVTFALPVITGAAGAPERRMQFALVADESELTPSEPYGIYEPTLRQDNICSTDAHTLILVPALAVNQQGFRLGYGGGFYDRYLAEQHEATRLGTVFSPFYPRQLPTSSYDISIGYVATELGIAVI